MTIPEPLWPAETRPKVTARGKRFHVWQGGEWWGMWESLDIALRVARAKYCDAVRHSEYVERREKLARFLCDLVYGEGAWVEAESDVILNYRLDADDIIKANPHLLSLGERERLEHIIPELTYPTGGTQ